MEKFYLGMDIGTNSVGIACTDEKYRLLRAKGKDCWAVRLFDESKTAETRRMFRGARRRLERRKQRLGFLQALFAPFIDDETFFIRLNNSQYYPEDKSELLGKNKNNLFADKNYTDKDYHKDFPTVYHLRHKLQTERMSDLRLYYIALHHILKYRGHFLFEGGMNDVRDVGRLFTELNEVCADLYSDAENIPYFDPSYTQEAKECLMRSDMGIRDKQPHLESLFGKDAIIREIIKGICGASISPKTLLGDSYKEEKAFSFKKITDETFDAMQSTYGDDFALLEKMRAIYSYIVFEKLLEGHPNVSSAMIKLYEDHKRDLCQLKEFLRKNAPDEVYKSFFKSDKEIANYVNYVGYTKRGGKKVKVKLCDDESFFTALKKMLLQLDGVKDTSILDGIIQKIDNGTFLPKILHSDNGLFPHQVNEDELVKIISNMVDAHPQTKEMADKILPLFLFKIPYYVGPLTGKNSWAVRSSEKITPWNFDEVVDKAQSNERFMRRMTNKCTYLHCEDVLPQASILYQKYNVLNQINKLKIDDVPIPAFLKQQLFEELFLRKKSVTDKAIINFLVRNGQLDDCRKNIAKITGKDGDIKASMSSYIRLKEILGDFVDEDLAKGGEICENIILWHTLNTDKNIVCDLILKNYGDISVIKDHIKQLKGLVFQKFGRFSKKFLTGIDAAQSNSGARISILDILYETNQNLNEILFNEKYNFEEAIAKENGTTSSDITYEDVENLYVSPAARRGIWQSLQMSEEYVRAIGKIPDKIFIECTREDGQKGDKGRKSSRKTRLLDCYKSIKKYKEYEDIFNELDNSGITDMRLRQERLYLYFHQLGRCMYTGERIDLEDLATNRYDVDHILPRCYIKDDSLDNKVLVLRSKNAEKRDRYPLPHGFSNQQVFWKLLLDKDLIKDVTYKRLTRVEPLSEDDYNDFINRQKVITDQTVKAVAELLKRKYPESKIVYSKAKNVSDFRQKFDIYKCRNTNDLHHARDAYLNVVVGNVFDTCFSTPMSLFYNKNDEWRTYNLKTMFTRNVAGAWDDNSISTVKTICAKNSMAVTRYAYREKGEFYNQTVYARDDKGITLPRKGKGVLADARRYGGYKGQSTAYFAIIQSKDKRGKVIRTIEAVPVLLHEQSKNDFKILKQYFENSGLREVEILVPEVKNKQLISYNGMPLYMTGVSGSNILCWNGVQFFSDSKIDEYVKALAEFYERYGRELDSKTDEFYIIKTNRMGEVKLKIDRRQNESLYNMLSSKLEGKIYSGMNYCATFRKILTDGAEKFNKLTVANQVKVLLQILNFFECNALRSDLSLIGGGAIVGTLKFNKNITDVDFRLIYQSPCGLTKRERKI